MDTQNRCVPEVMHSVAAKASKLANAYFSPEAHQALTEVSLSEASGLLEQLVEGIQFVKDSAQTAAAASQEFTLEQRLVICQLLAVENAVRAFLNCQQLLNRGTERQQPAEDENASEPSFEDEEDLPEEEIEEISGTLLDPLVDIRNALRTALEQLVFLTTNRSCFPENFGKP